MDAQQLKIRHSLHRLFACFQWQELLLVSSEIYEEDFLSLWCVGIDFFTHHMSHTSHICPHLEIDTDRFKYNINTVIMEIFLSSGFLTGGHVLRLFHGHMDECLAIATPEEGEEKRR